MSSAALASKPHCCPWWLGWLLVSPVRRWFLRPEDLVGPILEPGNRVLEVGPGMGFFTLPIAKRIGDDGRVHCVDVQPAMLSGLARRLRHHGLESRVDTRCCTSTSLDIGDLAGTIDVAVLTYVLHEMPDHFSSFTVQGKKMTSQNSGGTWSVNQYVSNITFE